ncbi:MAG: hypothetical protein NVS2B8_16810 [Vulcanimicrobiaceae bacterium]
MSSRRTFLAAGAAVAALAEPAALVAATSASSPYDFAAIDARLTRPAKHRQVMAVNSVTDGRVFGYAKHSMDAVEVAMGEGPGAMHVATVFYGRAVVLGVDATMWKKYRLSENLKRRGDIVSDPSDGHPFAADVASIVKRGATILVCDNALADWSTYLVTSAGFNDRRIEDVHADLRTHLIAGALLVPAGVAAVNSAQEAHFTYFQATM